MMEKSVLKILEYDKIRELLCENAVSQNGKKLAANIMPSDVFLSVQELMAQTKEAVTVCHTANIPIFGFSDISGILKKTKLGAILSLSELSDVLQAMYIMREIKIFFKKLDVDVNILKSWAHGIDILGQLEADLHNILDEHGEMRDDASLELKHIRKKIRSLQHHTKDKLYSILHNPVYQKCLQDNIITMRENRYVLPIKQEYRQYFPGIVHDQSASGSTVFIEPLQIVDVNNEVKQLLLSEKTEVEHILRIISAKVGAAGSSLRENIEILAKLDLVFAKAKLAEQMKAVEPIFAADGEVELFGARHPLLAPEKVVPINLKLGKNYRMLLVTGPNTGGKTVTMKTFGLLSLMAQTGLFIPAEAHSKLAIYKNIYADIGDEQSIEQSLSTFSAHMLHIIDILKVVTQQDLLLLDELGAGTDPEEGAALAMSILEHLLAVGTEVIATTHYSELKSFAMTQSGIENACVEFDMDTLRPTYRLMIGMPGASNAFAISRRLGLDSSLVMRAGELLQTEHVKLEQIINTLEQEKAIYEKRNEAIKEKERQAFQLAAEAEKKQQEILKKKKEIIQKAERESSALVRRSKKEAEYVIKKLKEQFVDNGIKKRQETIKEVRDMLAAAGNRVKPGLYNDTSVYKGAIDISSLSLEDQVYVTKLGQKGRVVSIHGKELSVQLGGMLMTVMAADCRFVSKGSHKDNIGQETKQFLRLTNKAVKVHREVDIRGTMADEAPLELGKIIDDAILAGLSEILLIHGKGTGALCKAVHEYLESNSSVISFAYANQNEGGTGATVINLK